MADTIFALATARGRAGIAVVRVSGPGAFGAAAALAGVRPEPRRPTVRWLRQPADGRRLDEALVLGFAAPASFTGEDVVELQLHGGPAVVRSVLEALAGIDGLRQAEPGEFTRRALVNGRLDLAQVEGLGDLIAAETAAQQRLAVRMLDGALSRLGVAWGEELVRALASIEVGIDFADEELPAGLDRGGPGGAGPGGGVDGPRARRQPRRRADPRRLRGGAGRTAERRQVDAAERVGRPRGGADLGAGGNHAGRDRGAARPRRAGADPARHRGAARYRASGSRPSASSGRGAGRRRPTCGCSWSTRADEVAALRRGAAAGRHRGAGQGRPAGRRRRRWRCRD